MKRILRPLLLSISLLCAGLTLPGLALAQEDDEQVEGTKQHPLEPPDTSSPRATFQSFLTDANAAWRAYLGRRDSEAPERYDQPDRHVRRAARTLNLNEIPPAQYDETAVQTVVLLLDVLNRVPFPAIRGLPNDEQMEAEQSTEFTLPHTQITIARVEDGPRMGEWLFTPQTVERAREFYRRTRDLPLKPGAVIEDGFEVFIALPGWMIPVAWIENLPEWAQEVYFEQTVWQWALVVITMLLTGAAGMLAIRRSVGWQQDGGARRALTGPVTVVLLSSLANYLIQVQFGITGQPYLVLHTALSAVTILAAAWGVGRLGRVAADAIVASPRFRAGAADAHLVRLGTRVLSFALGMAIVFEGMRSLGVPVMGVIAGLGVGGLAVALAAQSTIENFIGSLTIFADRPVRVGDFCRFGDQMGTVEQIGLRSTRIRTLDRSILTVPNAEFSRLQLDNLTQRDRILFRTPLHLRLETSSDQLRLVLTRLRELLLAHPMVDEEPARVRVAAVGPSSIDLELFAYVMTSDYNKFLGVREDLYLRMIEIVEQAGTNFAPPASTTYVAHDVGVDAERTRSAETQVEKWRRDSALPFPDFSREQREKLSNTLDYPPAGAPRSPGEDTPE